MKEKNMKKIKEQKGKTEIKKNNFKTKRNYIAAVILSSLILTAPMAKRNVDIDQANDIESLNEILYEDSLIPLTSKQKQLAENKKKNITDKLNKKYAKELQKYENDINNVVDAKFNLDDKYISANNLKKKNELDKKKNKVLADKEYLKDISSKLNDKYTNLEKLEIKDNFGNEVLNSIAKDLIAKRDGLIKEFNDKKTLVSNAKTQADLDKIETNLNKTYQNEIIKDEVNKKSYAIKKAEEEAKAKALAAEEEKKKSAAQNKNQEQAASSNDSKPQQKQNSNKANNQQEQVAQQNQTQNNNNTSVEKKPFSITMFGKNYSIVQSNRSNYQSVVDANRGTWVNLTPLYAFGNINNYEYQEDYEYYVDIYGDYDGNYKYIDDGVGLYLACHRDGIGYLIEEADSIIYTDPNGKSREYKYIGSLDPIQGGGYIDSEDGRYPYMAGSAGDYITFQTCTSYSNGGGIGQAHVFQAQ